MKSIEVALRLAEIRKQEGRSQAEVAHAMGTTQSAISRLERQDDLRVSTLRDYAAAVGGHLRVCVVWSDHVAEVSLGGEEANAEVRRTFRVIWQDGASRSFVPVGWLEYTGSEFVFSYTDQARKHARFTPFPAFPVLTETYRSTELFPYFAVRLINAADPSYQAVLDAVGLSGREPTPAELLERVPASGHDTIQIVPEPSETRDGTLVRTFLVSGVRHADELSGGAATRALTGLLNGQRLELVAEPTNPHNPRALRILHEGRQVGWLPDYLLDEVHSCLEAGRSLELAVERANSPEAPSHVRLLCRLVMGPPEGMSRTERR